MADNLIDFEGFEKYGPALGTWATANFNTLMTGASSQTYLATQQGFNSDWTIAFSSNSGSVSFIGGLNGTGTALWMAPFGANNMTISRNLTSPLTSYSRIIFGFAIMTNFGGSSAGVGFLDSGTTQDTLTVDSNGRIILVQNATRLYTSPSQVVWDHQRHYIEIDITFHNTAGHFQIWCDGVSLVNSNNTQNTRTSANNRVNGFYFSNFNTGCVAAYDDIYWRDNTNGTASPYGDVTIMGLPVSGDSSIAFPKTTTMLGNWHAQNTLTTNAPGANILVLVPVTPPVNMTLNSVSFVPMATSTTVKTQAVVYSDSSGAPGSLLSAGREVIGCVSGTNFTGLLATAQALTGGTQYWIGYITDTSVAVRMSESGQYHITGQSKANTYASGAPAGPLSGMTTGQNPWAIWGNCTGTASSYASVAHIPGPISVTTPFSFNASSTVSDEDLFTQAGGLSGTPTIQSVKVSALAHSTNPQPGVNITAGQSNGGAWTTNTSSFSWTHSGISGPNQILVVGISLFSASARTVTAMTAGGLAMTKIDSITASLEANTQDFETWYIVAPPVAGGSTTITVTLSGLTGFAQGQSEIIYGVDQAAPIDSHSIGQSLVSVASIAQATTVVSATAILVGFVWGRVSPTLSAGASTTLLQSSSNSQASGYSSSGIVGTGSQSLTWNLSVSGAVPGVATISLLVTSGWVFAPTNRTMDIRAKSNGVDSGGSTTGFATTTSPVWYTTHFDTDPSGGAAWTATRVNNMTIGYKVAS